jgi:hypothetical protein
MIVARWPWRARQPQSAGAVTATGFMPALESSGGATNNLASNVPVFQVQRIDNGQMLFIPTDETRSGESTLALF